MAINGRLEVVIKINELPQARVLENGWKSFDVDCQGQITAITVRPKVWRKLEEAESNFPMWVASITGKMGQRGKNGFVLDEPAIQVFEKKPKELVAPVAVGEG